MPTRIESINHDSKPVNFIFDFKSPSQKITGTYTMTFSKQKSKAIDNKTNFTAAYRGTLKNHGNKIY